MKVLKFGGTSVGSVESITKLKEIVEGTTEQVIVVVSALGGVTDKLIAVSHMAAKATAVTAPRLRKSLTATAIWLTP